jgi:peptide/nickel transport system permease protein
MATLEERRFPGSEPMSPRKTSFWEWTEPYRRNALVMVGLSVAVFVVILAIFAPVIAPADPYSQDLTRRVAGPSSENWFGTDSFGRDLLSRVIYGSQVTVLTSTFVVIISTIAGISIGMVAGYAGGLTDSVLMRLMDVLLAFPGILLAIGIMAVLGQGIVNVMIALGIAYTPLFARIVRGSVLSLRSQEFVEAAKALGLPTWRLLIRHILPNAMAPILIQVSIVFVYAIRAEAALSYLGIGTPPPTPSWGNLLQETQRFVTHEPILPFFPGLAIAFTILGLNLLGDGLRDVLDPRLRGSR